MTEVSASPGFTIDLLDAVKVGLPRSRLLKPVEFRTPDGRSGWVVHLPGARPLATPAYGNGRVLTAQGSSVHCVVDYGEDEDTRTAWEGRARGDRVEDGVQRRFFPPRSVTTASTLPG